MQFIKSLFKIIINSNKINQKQLKLIKLNKIILKLKTKLKIKFKTKTKLKINKINLNLNLM